MTFRKGANTTTAGPVVARLGHIGLIRAWPGATVGKELPLELKNPPSQPELEEMFL